MEMNRMVNFVNRTVAELREILRQRGLPVSGRKADLIIRLVVDGASQSTNCANCLQPHRNMQKLSMGGSCCFACTPWYRYFERSVRRTLAALGALGYDQIDDIREQAAELYHDSEQTHSIAFDERGMPYGGAIDDRHWSRILHRTTPSHQISNPFTRGYNIDKLGSEYVGEILEPLNDLGIRILPQATLLREQLAHFMLGTFGQIPKDRLVSVMLQWSTVDYFFRDPTAWARSFDFVQEVVSELGDRAHFTEKGIRVTGTSNNLYQIAPIIRPPFYRVSRIYEGQHMHICIDPIGAASVVFGDILVSLVLSLFEDQKSALRINTLHPHIFGVPRRHRNRNINHLWQRALGRHHERQNEDNNEREENVWQHLIDRFQTNLADWNGVEEEEV